MQLARRFHGQEGGYVYGAHQLDSASAEALEAEIVEPDPSSTVNFAVIDARAVQGSLLRMGAFRHDLDFYVVMGMSAERFHELKTRLESMVPVPVLCLATAVQEAD